MDLSQMIVQATLITSSRLLQLPHFTPALIEKAKKMKVEDITELLTMEDKPRMELLESLSQSQLIDVTRACNRFPISSINLEFKVQNADDLRAGGSARIVVKLARDMSEEEGPLGPVYAPFYPKEKEESWWLVVGGPQSALVAIKRITISKAQVSVKLDVELGEEPGTAEYTLYLISDSYQGCDLENNFKITTK
eukprot:NODE_752_length_1376_cov_233.032551.p2 GENE.NODE_752_length_1376_cov_233.032551~~NODE_752_length_1376_cov_233.032551.p2  ORF type:complete len:194 (+),score=73.79 NODE_752_length_1376_cov_233.032551:522-1103(+)